MFTIIGLMLTGMLLGYHGINLGAAVHPRH